MYERVANQVAANGNATLILRDIEKAFDKVWHEGLRARLLVSDLPNLLLRSASHFLEGRSAYIKERGAEGELFPLLSGVPQGSSLSPTLFALYTADTPPPNPRNGSSHVAFADDHSQLVLHAFPSKIAIALKTERAMEERNRYEDQRKIKNCIEKTKIITPRRVNPIPLEVDGQQMQYHQSGRILGLRITNRGIRSHVRHNRGKAKRQLLKLRRFSGLSPKIKLVLYKVLIRPILEYPAVPLNTISRCAMMDLQRVQSKALRWINSKGIEEPRKTNAQLHREYRIEPLNLRIHRLARRTWIRLDELQDPNLQDIVETAEGLEDHEEHRWFPRSRPRALGPPPPPLLLQQDVRI